MSSKSTIFTGSKRGNLDGDITKARFNYLEDIVISPLDNSFFIADHNNGVIRQVKHGMVTTIEVGGGEWHPRGLAIDPIEGFLFVSDSPDHVIYMVDLDDFSSKVYAGGQGKGFKNGPRRKAKFLIPARMDCDTKGNLFVADQFNNCIRRIDSENGDVTTVAGDREAAFLDAGCAEAKFFGPHDVVVGENDAVLYVADTKNNRIRKIDLVTNVVTTVAGSEQGYKDGPASEALFSDPSGITVDKSGNIYVSDGGEEGHVRVIKKSGVVDTLVSNLVHPMGLCFSDGNLYLVEKGENRVQVIDVSELATSTEEAVVVEQPVNTNIVQVTENIPEPELSDFDKQLKESVLYQQLQSEIATLNQRITELEG